MSGGATFSVTQRNCRFVTGSVERYRTGLNGGSPGGPRSRESPPAHSRRQTREESRACDLLGAWSSLRSTYRRRNLGSGDRGPLVAIALPPIGERLGGVRGLGGSRDRFRALPPGAG